MTKSKDKKAKKLNVKIAPKKQGAKENKKEVKKDLKPTKIIAKVKSAPKKVKLEKVIKEVKKVKDVKEAKAKVPVQVIKLGTKELRKNKKSEEVVVDKKLLKAKLKEEKLKASGKVDPKKVLAKKNDDLDPDSFDEKKSADVDLFDDFDDVGTGYEEDIDIRIPVEQDEFDVKSFGNLEKLDENYDWETARKQINSLEFYETSEGDECQEKICENLPAVQGFCRLHYIKNWKNIKRKRGVLVEGKLQNYLEELVKKYPIQYIEEILRDLSDEKEFYRVLKDLNIDTSFVVDDAEALDDEGDDITFETRSFSDVRPGVDEEDTI